MILVLNFCHQDRDLAFKLLKWCGEIRCGKKHDLLLHFSQQVKRTEGHMELEEEAKKHFLSVSMASPPTEDERGWPFSPNHGWMSALQLIREKIMKPWLFWEPDATPITEDCFDAIEKEYDRVNPTIDPKAKNPPKLFPFMGAEVRSPAHRMSGVGVYPARVVAFLQNRRLADLVVMRPGRRAGEHNHGFREEAFDSYFAQEIIPNAHFTPLIQNIHLVSRDPDVVPTFPTQESLSLLDPRAVLFHRCKDGSLIDRLRENMCSTKASYEHPPTVTISSGGGTATEIPCRVVPASPSAQQSLPECSNVIHNRGESEAKRLTQSEKMKAVWIQRKAKQALAAAKPLKPTRTPEQQAALNERMAKARAGRKVVAA